MYELPCEAIALKSSPDYGSVTAPSAVAERGSKRVLRTPVLTLRPIIDDMKAAIERAQGLMDHGWYLREVLSYGVGKLEGS